MFNFLGSKPSSQLPPDPVDLKAAAADVLATAFNQIADRFATLGFSVAALDRFQRPSVEDTTQLDEHVRLDLERRNGDTKFLFTLESTPANTFADPSVSPSKAMLTAADEYSDLKEMVRFGKICFAVAGMVESAALQQWRQQHPSSARTTGLVTQLPIAGPHTPNRFNLAPLKRREHCVKQTVTCMRDALQGFQCFLNPEQAIDNFLAARWHRMQSREVFEYLLCFGTRAQAQAVFRRLYDELLVPLSEYDERSIEVRRRIGMPRPFDVGAPGRLVREALTLGIIDSAQLNDLPTFRDKWQ